MPFLVIAVAAIWLKRIGQWEWESPETVMARIKLLEIFTPAYWAKDGRMIWRYVKGENFTLVYVITALLGITIAAIRRKGLLDRYIIGWALAIIPYCMIFSDFITQHNYYQMPFLPLVCMSSVSTLFYPGCTSVAPGKATQVFRGY